MKKFLFAFSVIYLVGCSGGSLDPLENYNKLDACGDKLEEGEFKGKATVADHGASLKYCLSLGKTATLYDSETQQVDIDKVTESRMEDLREWVDEGKSVGFNHCKLHRAGTAFLGYYEHVCRIPDEDKQARLEESDDSKNY